MADAKRASSPSVGGDGSLESTAPVVPIEGTTNTMTVADGGDTSGEESEETPEAKALAQGLCNPLPLSYTTIYSSLSRS
jgi:hypothetical protein